MIIPKKDEIMRRREAMGLTRSALSRCAGLPPNALGRIERGETEYTYPIRAKAIAEALGCELEEIFLIK